MSQPPNQPCSSWGNHLSKECMETSLVCIAQNLYGPEPQQMLNGILKLMCRKYVQQHGNDLQFESDLLSFIPNSREAETSIAHFPRDVLQRIAYFLRDDPKTLGILAQVCRTWRNILQDLSVWQDVCEALWACTRTRCSYTIKLKELIGQDDFRPSLLEVAPLVFAGAKLDAVMTPCGGTPLLLACYHGHLNVVDFLLRNGASCYEEAHGGRTPIMVAAFRNHQEVVAYFVHRGCNLAQRDKAGNTLFMLACLGGALKVMTWLKAQGVSLTDTNIYGQTALHCAAMGGHAEALARVIQYGFEIDKRSLEGQTPLLVAAAYGRPAAIATLAQYGADLSARDRNGANAVMLACVGCRSCGLPHPNGLNDHALIVYNILAQHNSQFNVNDRDNYGRTALHYALVNKNFPAVQKLHAMSIDQNAQDVFGATAQDYVILNRSLGSSDTRNAKQILDRLTGVALTIGTSSQSLFTDIHFCELLRLLHNNNTVQQLVLMNSGVTPADHEDELLSLLAVNRTLVNIDLGLKRADCLPPSVSECLASNRYSSAQSLPARGMARSAVPNLSGNIRLNSIESVSIANTQSMDGSADSSTFYL